MTWLLHQQHLGYQFSETFSKHSSAHQYLVCPPLESMHAWQWRLIDATSVLKNAWGIPFQILTSTLDRSGNINGWFWRPRKRHCISSQTCSIGDKSGEIAGQGSTLTLFWIKKLVTTSATCGRALSCCSVALCCTDGRTWGLMPVSLPSTMTRAVLHGMRFHLTPWYYLRRKDAAESHNYDVMETFTNMMVHSRTTVTAVEMKPGYIREKNTCPVLLCEVYMSSTPGEMCYMMTLLENRTCMAGRRGCMPRSCNRLRSYRGLILLRPGILLAVKVAVLSRSWSWTTRMYVSWWLEVTRGRPDRGQSLVVPNCWYWLHKASTVFRCTPNCLATSVWRTPASVMPTACHLSVSFNLGMAYQRCFSKLSWFSVLQASTLCLYTCLVDKRVYDLTAAWKNLETKMLAKQTNYPCNSCTDQCKWQGWIHNLPV